MTLLVSIASHLERMADKMCGEADNFLALQTHCHFEMRDVIPALQRSGYIRPLDKRPFSRPTNFGLSS